MAKKVSMQTLDAIVKSSMLKTDSKESMQFGDIIIEFTLKQALSLPERSAFVDRVVAGSLSGDIYISEYVDVFKEIAFYQVFTNLPVPTVKSDDETIGVQLDIQRTYDFCKATKLTQEMTEKYPEIKTLYDNLCSCADKQIEFNKAKILSQEHYILSKTAEQMDSISEQMGELFAGFDGRNLSSAINVISEIDKSALIDAIAARSMETK